MLAIARNRGIIDNLKKYKQDDHGADTPVRKRFFRAGNAHLSFLGGVTKSKQLLEMERERGIKPFERSGPGAHQELIDYLDENESYCVLIPR